MNFILILLINLLMENNIYIKKGDMFNVPSWKWVDCENSSDCDKCGIEYGGTVKVVGEYDKETVLCRYYNKDRQHINGTPCVSGTLFLIRKSELLNFNKEHAEITNANKVHQNRIKQLLLEE